MSNPERQYYHLNGSQSVALFQAMMSFHKEVIQIPFTFTFRKKMDHELFKKAFQLEVERFDCLRSRYVKKDKKNMQYFLPPYEEKKFYEFDFSNLTAEQEAEKIQKLASKPLKFKKGEVYRFCIYTNHEGTTGILFIVSHMNMDAGGIFTFFADLVDVYIALENGTELPAAPASFEESVKKELVRFLDPERRERSNEFLRNMLKEGGEPLFTTMAGTRHLEEFRKKKKDSSLRYTNLLFFNNKTNNLSYKLSLEDTNKILAFCEEIGCTPMVFFKMALWTCLSRMNEKTNKIMWLTVCNGRATILDQRCAGTKAQAMVEYPKAELDEPYVDGLRRMNDNQAALYTHFGNEELVMERIIKRTFGISKLGIYHAFIISYIPVLYRPKEGYECQAKWICTGSFALPAYAAISHSMEDESFEICYDFQIKLANKEEVDRFHKNVVKCMLMAVDNRDMSFNDIIDKLD